MLLWRGVVSNAAVECDDDVLAEVNGGSPGRGVERKCNAHLPTVNKKC